MASSENGKCGMPTVKWHDFSWGYTIHVYLSQRGSPWHTKVQVTSKFNLMNQWVLLRIAYRNMSERLVTGKEMTQKPPRLDDSFQELGTWSWLCSLQAAGQGPECPFQMTVLVQMSSRQLWGFLLLPDSWSAFNLLSAWRIWDLLSVVFIVYFGRKGVWWIWYVSGTSWNNFELFTHLSYRASLADEMFKFMEKLLEHT